MDSGGILEVGAVVLVVLAGLVAANVPVRRQVVSKWSVKRVRGAPYQFPSTTADLEPEEAFSEVAAGAAEARAITPETIKAVLMMKAVITSVSTDDWLLDEDRMV
jgi:hypothetical protein